MSELDLLQQILSELQTIRQRIEDGNASLSRIDGDLDQLHSDLLQVQVIISDTVPLNNTYSVALDSGSFAGVRGYQSFTVGDMVISLLLSTLLVIEILRLIFRAPRGLSL